MKKLLIAFGSLLALLVLAAIIVPLVVDVDKYRPTIVSKANEYLNGKLELGKLGLSLWGHVKVDIDGLKLSDSKGRTVVAVKDASFNMPFLSLLTGSPSVSLKLAAPTVNVVKEKDGKLNALTLVKETPAPKAGTPGAPATGTSAAGAPSGKGTEVPAIVMNARITFVLSQAKLDYKDELTGDNYAINDLNFRLEDVSPSGNMPFEVGANLDMLVQHKIKVTGPVVLNGNVKATSSAGGFEKADAKASLKLDGAEIIDPGLFNKKKGTPLGADLEATVGKDSFSASKIVFRIAQVEVNGEASGKTAGNVTTIDFKAHSNKVDLAKLGELSPMITEYGVNGLVELSVHAEGPTDKLGYGANVKFNKIVLNHESLKQPLEVDGSVAVATNQVQSLAVRIAAAKDFDVSLAGNMQNFAAPRFNFKLSSNVMDLDGLLKASEKAAIARKEAADKGTSAPASGGAPAHTQVVDYNAMFEPLRKMPIAAAAAGTFDFNLKKIKSTGVVIDNMQGQLALNNLLLALKDFSMKIFDGSIKGTMSFNVKPAKPEVATNITCSGLETQKMVESSMPMARNTIKGVISAGLNIGGSGLNMSDIISNWKGNGSMDVKNAVLSTLDVGSQIKVGVIDKLPPFLKGKVNVPDKVLDKQGRYDTLDTKFALANGVMHINEINGKAHPNEGLDLKGNGSVKLADYGLDLTLDIIDTYNLLGGDQYAKDQRYGHFALSPKVGGSLFSPKFDWGATLGKLAENALKGKGQELLKEKAKGLLGGSGGGGGLLGKVLGGGGDNQKKDGGDQPKPQDAVKNALKGLFGH